MTYSNDIQHIQSPTPTAFPTAPGMIDTASLRGLIPVLLTQLAALFTRDHIKRGATSRIRAIRVQLQTLYKAERSNFCLWLIRAMSADPVWQAAVREDLGGEKALAAWEARRERLYALKQELESEFKPKPSQFKKPPRKTPNAGQGPRPIITDRHGLFRLAPLTQDATPVRDASRGFSYCERPISSTFLWPKPIGLTPDD